MTPSDAQNSEVLKRLLSMAAERFQCPRETLAPELDLFDTLGIDSMQALSLLSSLEEVFDVEIPDYEIQDVRTFAQLADVVAMRL